MAKRNGAVLAVLHKLEHSLAFFDVGTGAALFSIRTGDFPHELCVSPDHRKLYVTEYGLRGVETVGAGGNTVGVYDVRQRQRSATMSLGEYCRPHGITMRNGAGTTGRLFVTSEPRGFLLILDAASGALQHAVQTGQQLPHLTAIAPDGRTVYTANVLSNSLTAIDAASGSVLANIPVLARREGMAFALDGKLLYVVNRESRAIAIVDTHEQKMSDQIETGPGPVRIVITPDGKRLAFPLFHADALQLADTQSRAVTHTIPVGRQPAGVALAPDGTLVFVSCELERAVYVVSLVTNEVVNTIKTGEGPDAIVCLDASDLT